MKKNTNCRLSILLAAAGLCFLTACGAKNVTGTDKETVPQTENGIEEEAEQSQEEQNDQDADIRKKERESEAKLLLDSMTEAIEMQYPELTFTDMKDVDDEVASLSFKDSFLFSGRKSSAGWRFIAAVDKTEDNPLEGVSCRTGAGPSAFHTSQFDGGKILLLEDSDSSVTDLSYLYDSLQRGKEGVNYLADAAKRGVRIIPPSEGSFLKVSLIKNGGSLVEFVPLSQEEAKKLEDGQQLEWDAERGIDGIALCKSREELPAVWNASLAPPTKEMVDLAREKCGFENGDVSELSDFKKAVMRIKIHGETREETIENRDDLARLAELLSRASYGELPVQEVYEGILTLTGQDGQERILQMSADENGFILGTSVYCEMDREEYQDMWSVFSTIEGFRKYGNQIHMEMTAPSFQADDENLTFTLINDTGKPIQYILSPIVYKKEGVDEEGNARWKRMDGINGFCGFTSSMEGEQAELSVPWKDAFAIEGAGIYKLEIGVMPEQDLRFEISDTFVLEK